MNAEFDLTQLIDAVLAHERRPREKVWERIRARARAAERRQIGRIHFNAKERRVENETQVS
jgi:hypothetical protein